MASAASEASPPARHPLPLPRPLELRVPAAAAPHEPVRPPRACLFLGRARLRRGREPTARAGVGRGRRVRRASDAAHRAGAGECRHRAAAVAARDAARDGHAGLRALVLHAPRRTLHLGALPRRRRLRLHGRALRLQGRLCRVSRSRARASRGERHRIHGRPEPLRGQAPPAPAGARLSEQRRRRALLAGADARPREGARRPGGAAASAHRLPGRHRREDRPAAPGRTWPAGGPTGRSSSRVRW